jgi:hypothetical protein
MSFTPNITILKKKFLPIWNYCPEQFEILGTSDNGLVDDKFKKTSGLTKEFVDDYYKAGGTGAYKEGNPTAGYYENNIAKSVMIIWKY